MPQLRYVCLSGIPYLVLPGGARGFYPQDAVKACNWRRIAASSARIDRAQSPAIEKRKTG